MHSGGPEQTPRNPSGNTKLFDVDAVRVTATPEVQTYLGALAEKYSISDADLSDFQPDSDEPPAAILFRLDSRHD